MAIQIQFWKQKTLNEMTREEWESLCDGCGICCLEKLEDEESGDIFYTNVTCGHLDTGSCRCSIYNERYHKAPECFDLSPANINEVSWLPVTCAYRLINEGKVLFWWHYLISGSRETIHDAGVSVRNRSTAILK